MTAAYLPVLHTRHYIFQKMYPLRDQCNKTRSNMARFMCLTFLVSISTASDFLLENKELDFQQIQKFIKETELIIRNDKHFDFKGFLSRFDRLVQQQITDLKIDDQTETEPEHFGRNRRDATTVAVTTSYEDAYTACLSNGGSEADCTTAEYTDCVNQCVNEGTSTKDACDTQCASLTPAPTTIAVTTVPPTTKRKSTSAPTSTTSTKSSTSSTTTTTEAPNKHEGLEVLILLLLVYEIFSHGSSDLGPSSGSANLMVNLGMVILLTFLARKFM